MQTTMFWYGHVPVEVFFPSKFGRRYTFISKHKCYLKYWGILDIAWGCADIAMILKEYTYFGRKSRHKSPDAFTTCCYIGILIVNLSTIILTVIQKILLSIDRVWIFFKTIVDWLVGCEPRNSFITLKQIEDLSWTSNK